MAFPADGGGVVAGAAADRLSGARKRPGEAAGDIAATGEPVSISFDYPSEEAMLADMTLAAQNSRYALYVQASSMAVALLDKATGKAGVFQSLRCRPGLLL